MTITSGGLFLVTNASCLAAGCPLVLTSWDTATDPHQRWVWDHLQRLRPLSNNWLGVNMNAAGTPPTLQTLVNVPNQQWSNTGEERRGEREEGSRGAVQVPREPSPASTCCLTPGRCQLRADVVIKSFPDTYIMHKSYP
jgi:hypothetical protein